MVPIHNSPSSPQPIWIAVSHRTQAFRMVMVVWLEVAAWTWSTKYSSAHVDQAIHRFQNNNTDDKTRKHSEVKNKIRQLIPHLGVHNNKTMKSKNEMLLNFACVRVVLPDNC